MNSRGSNFVNSCRLARSLKNFSTSVRPLRTPAMATAGVPGTVNVNPGSRLLRIAGMSRRENASYIPLMISTF